MFYADYHMHTHYSPDSDASMEDMIRQAIKLGLSEIAFTDHVDYDGYTPAIDFDAYIKELKQHQKKYALQIQLTFGVEIGLGAQVADDIEALISAHDFDFVIGSSHGVNGTDLYYGDYFENKTKEDAYTTYFLAMLENINRIKSFCVYGHFDFISRYGTYPDNALVYEEFKDVIDPVLVRLVELGKGIEINTSGFRYHLNQTYPQLDIVKRYKQLGGEIITIGSDAHRPENIAERFDVAMDMLATAGFDYITLFRKQKPVFHKIGTR